MGTFYVKCRIENPVERTRTVILRKLLVDTGSEFSWVPEKSLERIGIRREKKDVSFVLANGERVTRSVGFGIIRLDKHFTIDELVFAEPGDLALLGARTLEGLNLTIDAVRRRLVTAGPLPTASPTRHDRDWSARSGDDGETVLLRADTRVYSRNQMASLQDDQRSPPGEQITDLQEIEPPEVAVARVQDPDAVLTECGRRPIVNARIGRT